MNRAPLKPARRRKCKTCRELFRPRNTLQKTCSPICALEFARTQGDKIARAAIRRQREKLKTRGQWLREAQAAFNGFIRARDEGQPCICCGRYATDTSLTGSKWDAGHYRSTGAAPELRFNEDNCHRQLVFCNRHRSGNAVEYRLGLIKRIGLARVEALEAAHEPKKYTIDDLKQIRDTYRAKRRALIKQRKEAA